MGDRLHGPPHVTVDAAIRPRYFVVAVVTEILAGYYLFREDRGIRKVLDEAEQVGASGPV